ncbi:MAG: uncharacterized protein KVP18_001488 [Porospora cf. gigantea A]|uniref:uncharacterized protein n=1 Tax=Porospora cf. gigantea A TaxID=2853593 RepID=UPI003559D9BA|nr:MAG: hypothetical protein KVP18_001488 [Porospora cf. gigantea A]
MSSSAEPSLSSSSVKDVEDQSAEFSEFESEPGSMKFGSFVESVKHSPRVSPWKLGVASSFLVLYLIMIIWAGVDPKFSPETPMFTDDRMIIGIIWMVLVIVFGYSTSGSKYLNTFFKVVPTLFLLYLLNGIAGSCNVFNPNDSSLYTVASHYGLPACLALLCLNCDVKEMSRLGWRSLLMFFTATLGVVFGGPLAIALVGLTLPQYVCGDKVWRGLSYTAGSWIGGGANATAMVDIFQPSPDALAQGIAVDIIWANLWVAVLFVSIGYEKKLNQILRADNGPVEALRGKMIAYEEATSKIPMSMDLLFITAIGLVTTGASNFLGKEIADAFDGINGSVGDFFARIAFNNMTFWRVMLATMIGLTYSFTPLKKYEGVGASKVANILLYFLILTIGMMMDITKIVDNPPIFLVGFLWILTHAVCLVGMGYLIKAPLFFLAVGSQANIGGAASAPIVAGSFHPSLAPVGALFAIFGYILGTWGAWACTLMMEAAAPVCPA